MRNAFFNTAIISFILFINNCSCTKESAGPVPVLPPITQTGANTFGCKVNGKIWVSYWPCGRLITGTTELNYIIEPINSNQTFPISFYLNAGDINSGESLFQLYNISVNIHNTGNIYDSLMIHYFGSPGNDYGNYPAQPGDTSSRYFQITKLDTVKKIISGVFAFTLYAANDSVVVTDGRFDLKIGRYDACTQ